MSLFPLAQCLFSFKHSVVRPILKKQNMFPNELKYNKKKLQVCAKFAISVKNFGEGCIKSNQRSSLKVQHLR